MELTKRQKTLLDRLVTLGTWVADGRLPVQVTEVYGFGSFFRGKTQPRDVDLVLRRSSEDTGDFQLFSKLLDEAAYGDFADECSTPQEAMLRVFDQHYSGDQADVADIPVRRHLFEEWIEGYTWGMLFDPTYHRQLTLRSATEISRRLIKRRLPNLNVAEWLTPGRPIEQWGMAAGFSVIVWSQEKPDIRTNVQMALAQDQRRASVLAELAKFDPVLFRQETLYGLLMKAIEQLLRTPQSRTRAQSVQKWLQRWAKRNLGPEADMLESAMTAEKMSATLGSEALARAVNQEFVPRSYEGVPLEQLSEIVEEKRKRIKSLWRNLEVCPNIVRALAAYKSRQVVGNRTAEDSVLGHLRSACNQRQWKLLVPILTDLGMAGSPRATNCTNEK